MSGPAKIRLRIGALKIPGATPADAAAVADALRLTLADGLRGGRGATEAASQPRLSLNLTSAETGPAQKGAAIGRGIAAVLAGGKG